MSLFSCEKIPKRPLRGRPAKGAPSGKVSLLAAATKAFSGLGFDRADLRSIATAAGVSPNLVRIHFGSKVALWDACLDEIVKITAVPVAEVAQLSQATDRPVRDRVVEAIGKIANLYTRHPEVRAFVSLHLVEAPERAAQLTQKLLHPAFEALRPLLEEAMSKGVIAPAHPAIVFGLINSAVSAPPSFPGLITQIAPELDSLTARQTLLQTFISLLLQKPAGPEGHGEGTLHD